MVSQAQRRNRMMCHFSLRFIFLCGVLFTLINSIPSTWLIDPLNRFTAHATGLLLNSLGIDAIVREMFVSYNGFSIKIIGECSAIFLVILYCSFIIAYPANGAYKARGLIVGASILFAANQIRIVIIFLIGLASSTLFEYVHVYLGQIFMLVLVLTISMSWFRSFSMETLDDSPLRFLGRFLTCSCLPFIFWIVLAEPFVHINLFLIKRTLASCRMDLIIPNKLGLFPYTFNTFHMVGFTALIFATRSIPLKSKLKGLAFGQLILCFTYFLFLFHQVLFVYFHIKHAMIPYISLIIINQWILPFVLWLAMIRSKFFLQDGKQLCPLCGAEKRGLLEHIRAKHGESAVNLPQLVDIIGRTKKDQKPS